MMCAGTTGTSPAPAGDRPPHQHLRYRHLHPDPHRLRSEVHSGTSSQWSKRLYTMLWLAPRAFSFLCGSQLCRGRLVRGAQLCALSFLGVCPSCCCCQFV